MRYNKRREQVTSFVKARRSHFNKKGVSAVVATVLIILIVVAAIGILWVAIMPMIQDMTGSTTECFDASSALSVVADNSCYDGTNVKVQVHRGAGDFELTDIKIIVGEDGTTNSVLAVDVLDQGLPDVNEDKVYTVPYSNVGDPTQPDEASVAAIVQVGNTESECTKGSVLTLSACA